MKLGIKDKPLVTRPLVESERCPYPRAKWVGRLGLWAFAFFLFKGLLWLIIPAVLWFLTRS